MRRAVLLLTACAALAAVTSALGDSGVSADPADNITATSAVLHGHMPTDGSGSGSDFEIEGNSSVFEVRAGASGDVSAAVTGLTPDTEYKYFLKAFLRGTRSRRVTTAGPVYFRTLPPQSDVAAEEDVSSSTPRLGDTFTFNVIVTNTGPDGAEGIAATITLGAGLDLLSVTPVTGTCTAASPIVCTIDALDAGGKATITVAVRATAPGTLTSTMQVTSTTQDPVPANNAAGASVTVAAPPPPPVAIRRVTLTADGRGGRVSSSATVCRGGVAVAVDKARGRSWRVVAHSLSAANGTFAFHARLTPGRYRARVGTSTVGTQRCAASTSRPRTVK